MAHKIFKLLFIESSLKTETRETQALKTVVSIRYVRSGVPRPH